MNNQFSRSEKIERHFQLWIYLLPVVGIVPAIWTLYRPQKNNRANFKEDGEQKKASRLSLNLVLIWLISYSSLSIGAANASDIMSFRLLYANAIVTTTYFVTCTLLMLRLGNKNLSSVSKIDRA